MNRLLTKIYWGEVKPFETVSEQEAALTQPVK
jgi:hypothetical protein